MVFFSLFLNSLSVMHMHTDTYSQMHSPPPSLSRACCGLQKVSWCSSVYREGGEVEKLCLWGRPFHQLQPDRSDESSPTMTCLQPLKDTTMNSTYAHTHTHTHKHIRTDMQKKHFLSDAHLCGDFGRGDRREMAEPGLTSWR